MGRYDHLSVAIPMMAESENIPTLIELFRRQTFRAFTIYCCVNNPEDCDEETLQDNQKSIELLNHCQEVDIHLVDRSSRGKGWVGKKKGVGWARKELFAQIVEEHDDNEVIVSLDADTRFPDNYFEEIVRTLNGNPKSCALCVPYYHPLSGDEETDRAMLRYECYMRHYLIHLLQIGSPYAFTALGSAMAFPAWAYRRVGGITPLQGGEDFYLMQKFAKTGHIERKMEVRVEPQGRISHRVPFGTGPAISKGVESMDESYPFYSDEGFRAIEETYTMLPALYERDVTTPMTAFLQQLLATEDIWGPLRKNFKRVDQFVHACHERIDGLRILQFLKSSHYVAPSPMDFAKAELAELQDFRNELYKKEMSLR